MKTINSAKTFCDVANSRHLKLNQLMSTTFSSIEFEIPKQEKAGLFHKIKSRLKMYRKSLQNLVNSAITSK